MKLTIMNTFVAEGTPEQLSEYTARVNHMGIPMHCDSRIKVGHIWTVVFDEKLYQDQRREKNHDKG